MPPPRPNVNPVYFDLAWLDEPMRRSFIISGVGFGGHRVKKQHDTKVPARGMILANCVKRYGGFYFRTDEGGYGSEVMPS